MAHITLTGTLLTPAGKTAYRDQIRFTHKSTTGETVRSSVDLLTIIASGFYYVELEYGLVLIEYKSANDSQFKNLGVATVNGTNPSTSIPELLNGLVPVSSAELIQFQAILADAVTAKNESVTARNEAEAFANSIDLINDLSQTYIFTTVAAFKASLIVFPDGKVIHLLDRGADFTKVTGNTATLDHNIIFSTGVNQSIELIREVSDSINAEAYGGVFDFATDNTVIVQACVDTLSENPTLDNSGGNIYIPRGMRFDLKSLTFKLRQNLYYFLGDDSSTTPSSTKNTNELVRFSANANTNGIVNECQFVGAFHPGHVVSGRKDVTGHQAALGAGQSVGNPARVSYNIRDEELSIWRAIWQNYNVKSDFSGVALNYFINRITITGINTSSFSTVPAKGDVITGTTSGAKGIVWSIDGSELLLTWITGLFQAGETVSDSDETTTATITTQARASLASTQMGWNVQDGQIVIDLPTNLTNTGEALNVGGKVLTQNTRSFGSFQPKTTTSPGFVWLDDLDTALPAGLEVTMNTTVAAGKERLELHKTDGVTIGGSIGHVGAVRAYTNFSNTVITANSSYNVEVGAIVRNGVGDYTVTFTEAFSSTTYTPSLTKGAQDDNPYVYIRSTDSIRIRNYGLASGALADLTGQLYLTIVGGDF